MAKKDTTTTPEDQQPGQTSEKDKAKARRWFEKARQERERRNYDYAIECYLTGLEFWPDAVEEGHKPLYSLAIQRQQSGGKKPGRLEALKRSTSGKDPIKAMLNAEYLLAKDPSNASYLDALFKNAAKAQLFDTFRWITPLVADSLRKDEKPNMSRFKMFRALLVDVGAAG